VDITVAGAPVTLVPCEYWFTEKILRDTGSSSEIQRTYDDSANIDILARCSAGRQGALFKSGLNMENNEIGKYGLTKPLPVGTRTFYIPILGSVFENFGGLYLEKLQGELSLELTTPATIIASGSGTISSDISFVVEGSHLTDMDIHHLLKSYEMHATETQFLQAHRSQFSSQRLTAGQTNKLVLRDVDGLCAFQAIFVRPVGAKNDNTNFNQWKLLNIGDANGAAIDLSTSGGVSILGNGAPVPSRLIRQHQSVDQFDNDFFSKKPVYIVNYSDSIREALRGKINGGYNFDGQRADEIRLVLPPAPVQEVQTVTFSTTPAAGSFYSFVFKGNKSAQLPIEATPAQMKAVIEAMPELKAHYVTAICSAAASAGASFSITFEDPEGILEGDLLTVESSGAVASNATARTVAAVPGLVSGDYDVTVYSYLFHRCGYVLNKLRRELIDMPNAQRF
jgi:hypothetical protein